MTEINITASAEDKKATKKIPVTLVGERYEVLPPKSGSVLAIARFRNSEDEQAMSKAMDKFFDWIRYAFGDQAESVFDRLDDPNDLLDFHHINELQQALMEYEASPNPTTSSRGSQTSRKRSGPTSRATRSA